MAEIEPTDADRDTFRDRLKDAIAQAGTTAKAIEERLDLSRGTLTRIYGGRRQLDAELLGQLAGELSVDPASLVVGTSFEELLAPEPVRPPEQTEVVEPSVVGTVEAHASEVEASIDDVVTTAATVEEVIEEAEAPGVEDDAAARQTREPGAEATEGEEPRRRARFLTVPVKAAVAIAGGLALVGGTLAALIRRK